ncbi:MAG: class I SAM-dependent methyltransferase [Planctomycetes bacterium]|nr:class I SAM-dependent methyltransferase [Planctomycetota bacterium]
MRTRNTDRDWQVFGQVDPYWAVAVKEEYHRSRLTEQALREFFASGASHVAAVFQIIRQYLDPKFQPASALDFGCGVGRLLVPLAQVCGTVVGVDVSPGMLQEARARCDALGLSHVRLLPSDDNLSAVQEKFDLVHSYIVLQHIPCERGVHILGRLLEVLHEGGVGALHFTYGHDGPPERSRYPRLKALVKAVGLYPVVRGLRQFGRSLRDRMRDGGQFQPYMQMNAYPLNDIFFRLQQAGIRRLHVEFSNHGGFVGLMLLFKKEAGDKYLL